jgi:hypothetical protein
MLAHHPPARRLCQGIGCLIVTLVSLSLPALSRAGEITVFVTQNSPKDVWRSGQGAALTLGLLKMVQFEAEGARVASDAGDARMTYFTSSAAVKLPFTNFTPYAGLGIGLYHQSQSDAWKISSLDATFVGVKLRLANLVVVKGEYRWIALHGDPFLQLDNRLAIGAGIAF